MINSSRIVRRIASASGQSLAQVGETGATLVYLGNGNGTVRPDNPLSPRDCYYRNSLDQAVPSIAILSPNTNIPLENVDAYDSIECVLAFPPGAAEPQIMRLAISGEYATNGRTPLEQAVLVAATPTQDKIATFRPQPTEPSSTFTQILADPPFAYRSAFNLKYFITAYIDLAVPIAALASGEHQLALVYMLRSTGELTYATGTAVAAVGTLPSRSEFLASDVEAITLPRGAYPAGVLYLYYGQTALELADHLYQYDPRQLFEAMDDDLLDAFDLILTDSEGSVLSDSEGNVLLASE